MRRLKSHPHFISLTASGARLAAMIPCVVLAVALIAASVSKSAAARQAAQAAAPDNPPAAQQSPADQTSPQTAPPQSAPAAPAHAPAESQAAPLPSAAPASTRQPETAGEITEDALRGMLVGKQLFLRGGYLDNMLSYNEHGVLVGHSPQGSYTLCGIEINKVRLTKHRVELEGQRYGLHFLGALPYEDPTAAMDRVNITPRKKVVRITIDREIVVKPKVKKVKGNSAKNAPKATTESAPAAPAAAGDGAAAPASPASQAEDTSSASQAQSEIAVVPPAQPPAGANGLTTTTSPAHAAKVLKAALENIFAQPFDNRMMASMPEFWKLYYEAAAAKTDYRPKDPNVLRENMVDQKAGLTTQFEPPSNQYAQDHGVAGMCLYHVVVGADGKPGEIAVARPIGFGLDENAVDSIRKATFEPAMKDGKPVPVMLNLVVEFRIYSHRTAVAANPNNQPTEPSLPGPYSAQHP